jgi:hypothetical protein
MTLTDLMRWDEVEESREGEALARTSYDHGEFK